MKGQIVRLVIFIAGFRLNWTEILPVENLIFVELRRHTSEIYYYRTGKGEEVDFIYILPDGSRHLLQVCESLDAETTEKREVRALERAMKELGIDRSTIVTSSGERMIEVESGVIEVIAAWRLLLRGGSS